MKRRSSGEFSVGALVRGLKKGRLRRDTAKNAEERVKSHGRELVRQLFGRSSER